MILEFKHNAIPESLFKELEFEAFANNGTFNFPILPHYIMKPLSKIEAKAHFQTLDNLESKLTDNNINLSELVSKSEELPFIDFFPFIKDQDLTSTHLFTLGSFLKAAKAVNKIEVFEELPKEVNEIDSILKEHLTDHYTSFKLDDNEKNLFIQLREQEMQVNEQLKTYETQILQETSLKMTYPFPKEIQLTEFTEEIKKSKLLFYSSKEGFFLIDYKLPKDIKKLIEDTDDLKEILSKKLEKNLKLISDKIAPYYEFLSSYFQERQTRTFHYYLLNLKREQALIFPKFCDQNCLKIKNATLPVLKDELDHYIPLTIDLDKGSNVLFGANMAGKTTVLKTLYFNIVLVQFGLPVPAEEMTLTYPEEVKIHLKSSGNLTLKRSSFGEELDFIAAMNQNNSYYFIDELFQTTNPVGGTDLSKIILKHHSDKNRLIFACTQYPDVLKTEGVHLFHMQDVPLDSIEDNNLDHLLSNTPFIVEQIDPQNLATALQETKKPLHLALLFNLEDEIKENIKIVLKD